MQFKQDGKKLDIYLYGEITPWPIEDIGEQSSNSIAQKLQEADPDVIDLHINSIGGSVAEGWAMYNALKNHRAQVNTYADGFVASAALYPYLAGDHRYASDVSAFFLHEVSAEAWGYADDLRKTADDIDFMTEQGIKAFVDAAGMDAGKVRELMAAETWLDAETAKELGIVHEITAEKEKGIEQSALRALHRQIFKKQEKTKGLFGMN